MLGIVAAAWLAAGATSAPAQSLLAGWTFNTQTSQTTALTADLGSLAGTVSFTTGIVGSLPGLTLNGNGTVTVGQGQYLYAAGINSASLATLQSGVTIVAWVSIQGAPGVNNNSALYGLVNGTPGITGSSFVAANGALGYQILNSTTSSTVPTVRGITGLSDGTLVAGPSASYNTMTVGAETQTAVNFSTTGTSYTTADITAGVSNSKTVTSTATLAAFTGLGVGRIFAGSTDYATSMTVDEIDVYQGVLTAAQIAALSPAAVPEPPAASLLFLAAALVCMGRRAFRRAALLS